MLRPKLWRSSSSTFRAPFPGHFPWFLNVFHGVCIDVHPLSTQNLVEIRSRRACSPSLVTKKVRCRVPHGSTMLNALEAKLGGRNRSNKPTTQCQRPVLNHGNLENMRKS